MEFREKKRSVFSMGGLLDNFSSRVDSEKNDKAIKFAMFNGLAILLVMVSSVAACGVYFILKPFIKPLLWALLSGSALHPFKQVLARKFETLVVRLESSSKPVVFNLLLLPVLLFLRLSDTLGDFLLKYISLILKLVLSLALLCLGYAYTPNIVLKSVWFFMGLNKALLNFTLDLFSSPVLVGSVVVAFVLGLVFCWSVERRRLFSLGSVGVWVALTSYVAGLLAPFRIPLFVLFQSSLCAGYFYASLISTPAKKKDKCESENCGDKKADDAEKKSEVLNLKTQSTSSIVYIKWLALICLFVLLVSLPSFPYIFVLLILTYATKKLCIAFGIADIVSGHLRAVGENIKCWYITREEILLPQPFKNTLKVMRMLLDKQLSIIKTYCDSAATITVILGLLLLVIFGSIFLTVQAYKESVYFVQSGGSIINSTIVHNPELHDLLPEDWQSTIDSALNDAYIYVRESLAKLIRSVLKDKGVEEERRLELEKSALELWDRVYQAWVMPTTTKHEHEQSQGEEQPSFVGPTVTADAVIHSYTTLIDTLRKTPEVVSLKSVGVLLSENMTTLSAGLDSLLSILKGNFTLLLNVLSTFFSLIFGGGMSVINFTLHMVVFLTALFYLLSTSRQLYKPVEVVTQMSPKYGNKLAVAVENACQEVLAASVKLSVFYGMWTWLIHTVFQSNIVYLPAVFGAILGGVPVLGTYWVCLPACLDLWLVQQNTLLALCLLIAQLLPTLIVDSTVYNEIQGGHPYLTGLSVAGGMFWLGIEGAVVGPLMLCFLFVIINMASSIATSPSPPQSTND